MKNSKVLLAAGFTLTWATVLVASNLSDLSSLISALGGSEYKMPYIDANKNLGPGVKKEISEVENQSIFSRYCLGDANSPEIPQPNYAQPLVVSAALKLSQTKIDADAILKARSKKEAAAILAETKSSVKTLMESKVPGVVLAAQGINSQLEAQGVDGFNAQVKAGANSIAQSYIAFYLKNLVALNTELAKSIKPVDKDKLKNLGVDLEIAVRGDLNSSSVTLVHLHHYLSNLLVQFQKAQAAKTIPSFDPEGFGSAIAKLKAACDEILANGSKDVNLGSLVYSLTGWDEKIKKANLNDLSEEFFYFLADVDSNFKEISKSNPQLQAQLKVLSANYYKEAAGMRVGIAVQLSQTLDRKLAAELKKPAVNQGVNQFRYEFDPIITLLNDPDFQTLVLKLENPKYASQLVSEVKNYNVNGTLTNLTSMNQSLAKGDLSSVTWQVNGVVSGLANFEAKLKPATKEILNQFNAESSKLGTSEVIESMKSTIALLQGSAAGHAPTEISDELYYAMSGATSNLNEKLSMTEVGKKSLRALKSIADEFESFYSLNSSLNRAVSNLESGHFYFYGAIKRIYKLSDKVVPATAPAGTLPVGHNFLVQLCGEFRDRATMIEAKLKWIENLYTLPRGPQQPIDPKKNIWSQVASETYAPYLELAKALWEARRDASTLKISIPGESDKIDNPVPPVTVCETKFLFTEYLYKKRPFDGLPAFSAGFDAYQAQAGNCTADDKVDSYNFRGDSNFKHYSPESNGMIWPATSIAGNCATSTTAKAGQTEYSSKDCADYFKKPFNSRFNAARAGLATWLFRDDKHGEVFSSQGSMVAIYPHLFANKAPFSFSFDYTSTTSDLFEFDARFVQSKKWSDPDIGFNDFTGIGSDKPNYVLAYERLRDAVDRHTDWYSSGYNDKAGTAKEQAYSPFVASSYVMASSDGFTSCGTTVQCPPDGLKRWMFVFRVKPANWYHPGKLMQNKPINFETMWFDETSFGKSSLADSERAWDRLGTSLEAEMDSILYLINVNDSGGDAGMGDGNGDFKAE